MIFHIKEQFFHFMIPLGSPFIVNLSGTFIYWLMDLCLSRNVGKAGGNEILSRSTPLPMSAEEQLAVNNDF